MKTQKSFTTNNNPNILAGCFTTACVTRLLPLLLFLALPVMVQAQFIYNINNGTITITIYTGSGGAVIIPDTINGLPVTGIGGSAFNSTSVTSVTMGTNVTYIGGYAFEYCTNLTSVTMGTNVTYIGDYAFEHCTSLTNVTIPNSITNIGYGVFRSCTELASVTIPNSVTSIGYYAFQSCSSLTNLTMGTNITIIEDYAFNVCSNLTSVTIPNNVTNIGNYTFQSCSSLTNLTMGTNVTSIGNNAFYGCGSLINVSFPNSVTNLGNWAFENCANLVSIFFQGNAPTNPAMYAFYGDNKATLYYLSGTTGWSSFFDGVQTKMVNETNPTVTITAPVNCQNWSNGVFTMTGTTKGSVPLSGVWFQVNSNGWQLTATTNHWTNWTASASLLVGSNVLQAYTVDGYGSISTNDMVNLNCISLFNFTTNNGKIIITGYTGPDGPVVIPNVINDLPVASIGDQAFNGDANITSVTIPYGITNIGNAAFQSCTSLTNINIPNSITSIGNYAFSGTGLIAVMMGTNVASIGDDAFNGCPGLTSIYFEGNVPANVGSNVFLNDNNVAIYYLLGTTGWGSSFAGLSTVEVNENAAITFPVNGQSLTSGVFAMTGIASGSVPVSSVWFQINSNGWQLAATTNNWTNWTVAASLVAPSIISGTNVFQAYAADAFGDVSAIASVNFIFVCDFNYTYQRGAITITGYTGGGGPVIIPSTINGFPVTSIAANAFLLCNNATSFTVPSSITSIGNAAFDYCANLARIYFNGNAPACPGYLAFYGDSGITTVYYRKGTTGWNSGGWPSVVASYLWSVVVNETNPTLAITSPVNGQSLTNGGFSVTGNANGKVPLLGVWFQVNSNGWQPAATANNWTNWTVAASLVAPAMIPGTNALQAYAVDAFGNNSANATVNNLLWLPQVQTGDGNFGIQTNQFGFNINWASGHTVVVEACTDLANPVWTPVATNTGGLSYFSDPAWTNYPGRFYRLRSP